MNGRFYGNAQAGYGYSPDRSRDVDRFNPSTRANYPTNYNTNRYGVSNNVGRAKTGHYDGRGQWVED